MEKEKIIEYIKKRKTITVPSVQKRFSLSYNQATTIFNELVEEGKLFFDSGITYNVRADEPKMPQPDIKPSQRFSLSEYMRRKSLLRSEETDAEDDSKEDEDDDMDFDNMDLDDLIDDVEDEESRAYDRLIEALREEDDAESESVNDSLRSSEDSLTKMRNRLGALSRHYHIKQIFNNCINSQIRTESVGDESCDVITLPDGEQFKLEYEDGLMQIIYDGIAPADCTSAMRADSIIEEYKNLHFKAGKIVASVENLANSFDALLELYAAVVRIKHGGE